MCLQCTIIRIRDMDTEGSRSKETTGVRNEMLSKNTTNQLERYEKKHRHKKTDSKKRDHHRQHQKKEAPIVWPYLSNER